MVEYNDSMKSALAGNDEMASGSPCVGVWYVNGSLLSAWSMEIDGESLADSAESFVAMGQEMEQSTGEDMPAIFWRKAIPRVFEAGVRSRTQLLFLSRSGRFLPHRLSSGGHRFAQISYLLLCVRHLDLVWNPSRAGSMRIFMSLRVVSGAAAQDSHKKIQHPPLSHIDVAEIRDSGGICGGAAHDSGE